MEVYNEQNEIIYDYDLSLGWLETRERVFKHHEEIPAEPAVTHLEVMPGTNNLRHVVIDVPAKEAVPAWDEYENYQVYHPYTKEELDLMNQPTMEERLSALEDAMMEMMLVSAPVEQPIPEDKSEVAPIEKVEAPVVEEGGQTNV